MGYTIFKVLLSAVSICCLILNVRPRARLALAKDSVESLHFKAKAYELVPERLLEKILALSASRGDAAWQGSQSWLLGNVDENENVWQ